MNRRLLLLVPVLTYVAAYLYLAQFHRASNLFPVVVHEGGTLTLTKTILFASHFLGHIPVHTVLALYFVGVYACFVPPRAEQPRKSPWLLLSVLLLFVAASWIFSWLVFGAEDTAAYVFQRRQRIGELEQGGSWNLHLPSTLLQFALLPPYLLTVLKICGIQLQASGRGRVLIAASIAMAVASTIAVNYGAWAKFCGIWTDPRYQGHSVRELATFPLTYFPLPLFWMLARQPKQTSPAQNDRTVFVVSVSCATLFAVGFGYQCVLTLAAGLDTLTVKPEFTGGAPLGIFHLLSGHYFEHVLDTIYFTLLALWLYELLPAWRGRRLS